MSGNDEKIRNKRKRTNNTSKEQYEIYIAFIEADFAFKSGTINPTLGENYLAKKWELCNKLNAVGDGPRLKVEEWKKRFTDWKYATKSKFRKICEHRGKTGSGPHTSLYINELEDRALSALGKITVLGNNQITQYEGLALDLTPEDTSLTLSDNYQNSSNKILIMDETQTTKNIFGDKNKENFISNTPDLSTKNNEIPLMQQSNKEKTRKNQTKPLSVLTEQLIKTNIESVKTISELNQIVSKFSDNYINLKKEKLEFEKLKLQFEIEKFKFSNPEFKFGS